MSWKGRLSWGAVILWASSCGSVPEPEAQTAGDEKSTDDALRRVIEMQARDEGSPDRDPAPLASLKLAGFHVGMPVSELEKLCPEIKEVEGRPNELCDLDGGDDMGSHVIVEKRQGVVCVVSLSEHVRRATRNDLALAFEARLEKLRAQLGEEDLVDWPDGCANHSDCLGKGDGLDVGWRWANVTILVSIETERNDVATVWTDEACPRPAAEADAD